MSDANSLRTVVAQCQQEIERLTSGNTLDREDRIAELRKTIDWAQRRLAGEEPFQAESQALT